MIPAPLALAASLVCGDVSVLQDSILQNLGDGSTVTVSSVRQMQSRISEAFDQYRGCTELNKLNETSFDLEEMLFQITKSKGQ